MAKRLLVWSETNTSLDRSRWTATASEEGQRIERSDDESAAWYYVASARTAHGNLLDSLDSVFIARGDDLLPLGHWLPRGRYVIAADVAALRACEELLGCRSREISEVRIVHGLSQAQGIIRNL